MKSILDYETVALADERDAIVIIDQTLLPGQTKLIDLKTGEEIWNAIYLLQVRGAPAIGVCAGFGIYILMKHSKASSEEEFLSELKKNKDYLNSSRPTAVNLSWALERMEHKVISFIEEEKRAGRSFDKEAVIKVMHDESEAIKAEDIDVCRRIGENGLTLLKKGDGILTHCNAGQLATCKYGTATAPIYLGHERGYDFHVYCDETRPLLQGARLTAYELHSAGIDTTLICDNMSASIMKAGKIQAIFVGCDRVAANGDAANKIGTSVVATVAKHYGIPFYVCAPTSTIDMNTFTGDDIVIEQRKPEEVTDMWYKERMAPEGVKVYNPAFDVTDNSLISGIVTEYGVLRAPYDKSIKEMFEQNK
ncbi:MAG: S-methyl-5-thioribose-1-phosphate isomerase [Butyrivibrio sp.]|jgi:methylthioribose-1-phosphate isomerase|uniref:Methylthioribose-1-phosphate isomerase n=1 Tax=Butyrivibrio fibrisolvens TaxID=831 RepID=A0A1H9QII3_BUTFI|nr:MULTISPECIES: S-methyl-5-thioribose-1-phosphate isomerase [Butyrivibrio]MBQ1458133.1 S-methyl-5-thioribose-1-phosphate isomerase [Butyrivibrio sp.]SER60272.1 methylthioribose-1-phosphate isomerase [Butyrivibrio fibrisolvens]